MNFNPDHSDCDIITIIGARPQFIKAAAMSLAFIQSGIREGLLHTGQHFDPEMSDIFFKELGLPKPLTNLNIQADKQGQQTGEMLIAIERFLLDLKKLPKAILVYGDTNSTLAGALVAAKLQIPLIHIEAGLRSRNMAMPEEINRIITDRLSTICFCSSETGMSNLKTEGITKNVFQVGDVMKDSFRIFSAFAKKPDLPKFDFSKSFGLLTLHRVSNTAKPSEVQTFLNQLGALKIPVLWPIHPRWKTVQNQFKYPDNLVLTKPLSYLEVLFTLAHCAFVITDSGGLQKEAYWAKKKCFTLRTETEWIETIKSRWNHLISYNDPIQTLLLTVKEPNSHPNFYGDGHACDRIVTQIKNIL
jgi:UDP-GlcNAc3NAcA epimerase